MGRIAGLPGARGPAATGVSPVPGTCGARMSMTTERAALSCQPCTLPPLSQSGLSSTTIWPTTNTTEPAASTSTRSSSRTNPMGPRSSADTVRSPIAELPMVRPVRDSQIHMDSWNRNATRPPRR